jgi:L-fuculose-phosphate aldolase
VLTAIGDVMREAYKRGWITTRDGNISIRRSNKFYITPSGVRKTIIHPEHIIKLPIRQGIVLMEGDIKPSIEMDMHVQIQMSDNKTKSVVHLHPTNTIALMYKMYYNPIALQKIADDFPELRRYTKVGPIANYQEPGSKELADAVFDAIAPKGKIEYDIVGLDRHGVVAVAQNPWDAFEHIERLEHIAEIYLKSGV